MNSIVKYIVEANLGLLLILALYWLLLRKETQFSFKRFFLLGGALLALLLPLVSFSGAGRLFAFESWYQIMPSYSLSEITINGFEVINRPLNSGMSIFTWVRWVYLTILMLLSLALLIHVFKIVVLFRRSEKYRWNGCWVIESDDMQATFSFFRFICIGRVSQITSAEKSNILQHEFIHATRLHSLDIILVNVIQVVFWFNPFMIVYKKILVQLMNLKPMRARWQLLMWTRTAACWRELLYSRPTILLPTISIIR